MQSRRHWITIVAETLPQLTERERQIVKLVSEGLSDKEIAQKLGTGAQAIKNSLHLIYRVTGAGSRIELLRTFYELVEKGNGTKDSLQ